MYANFYEKCRWNKREERCHVVVGNAFSVCLAFIHKNTPKLDPLFVCR